MLDIKNNYHVLFHIFHLKKFLIFTKSTAKILNGSIYLSLKKKIHNSKFSSVVWSYLSSYNNKSLGWDFFRKVQAHKNECLMLIELNFFKKKTYQSFYIITHLQLIIYSLHKISLEMNFDSQFYLYIFKFIYLHFYFTLWLLILNIFHPFCSHIIAEINRKQFAFMFMLLFFSVFHFSVSQRVIPNLTLFTCFQRLS